VPFWLISFCEGTRLTPARLEASREFARQRGLEPPSHCLVPRTKGFVASVEGLREVIDVVYDVTIGYVGGVPTLWQYLKGYVRVVHLHVRRFPADSLPTSAAELSSWLLDRFREKDRLLGHFYRHGSFPDGEEAHGA
jgi:hypothetical protein